MVSEGKRKGSFSANQLSSSKTKSHGNGQRPANDSVALKPPHLALIGQKIECPQYVPTCHSNLLTTQRKETKELIEFAVINNAVDASLIENLMSAGVENSDKKIRALLTNITEKMAGLFGNDTCPFTLALCESDCDDWSNDDSSRVGLYIMPTEAIQVIQCTLPFEQLNQWFAKFNRHITDLLGFYTIIDVISQEVESQLDNLDIDAEEIINNISAIKDALESNDETKIIEMLGIGESPWHDREEGEVLWCATGLVDSFDYLTAHKDSDNVKTTFKQLRHELCENVKETPLLRDDPFVQVLLSRLPIMSSLEPYLSSMKDVFNNEGDTYYGSAFMALSSNPSDHIGEVLDRHLQEIYEHGDTGYIVVDVNHPHAFQTLNAFLSLATEYDQLNQYST